MPRDRFDILSTVAKARGVDVSSILNWIITESLPHLLKEKADFEEAMLKAATSKVWARRSSSAEAMQELRELLIVLQDEYAKLVQQALGDGERRAG
jgi:hypothetical protein